MSGTTFAFFIANGLKNCGIIPASGFAVEMNVPTGKRK
jgi:hypothetical protein